MKISHSWLQKYFKEPLPKAADLAEHFNAHAFEVEGIEEIKGDTVLDVKVLPDRAHYALCHRGVAKEVTAITKQQYVSPEIKSFSSTSKIIPKVTVDSELCVRYMARGIESVSVTDSPAWLKTLLENIGQRSINTIVDATNYVMFDIGQPLHAFDADKVKGGIIVRLATDGEKITLLDGKEVSLLATDLVIADSEGPLAIAGVKGGKRAEVTVSTKNIILESANFNPTSVRRTSTRLNLRNDSSKRFENQITPELCVEALERVTSLILELSKNAKAGPVADVYKNPVKPWEVVVSVDYVNSTIGSNIPPTDIIDILKRMDCKVEEKKGTLTIAPPMDRLDMVIPEDIADEVGRIYGYNKLAATLPPVLKDAESVDKTFYYAEKVKNILVKQGFSEVLLYTLVPKGAFEIAYPLASDKAALRESIVPKLKDALVMNARNADLLELDTVKVFEIGKVFPKEGEKTVLCAGITVIKKKKGITSESVLKETIESIEKELNAKVSYKIETKENASVVEIDFDALIKSLSQPKDVKDLSFTKLPADIKYKPFSAYPFASRDIAVFVPKAISEEKIKEIIEKHAGKYLLKMRLFDVFTKEGDSHTSYAYRLIFQSFEKTLEEKEINDAMEAITASLNTQKDWKVR